MSKYREMAMTARKAVAKLTLQQQYEILEIYEDAIESLSSKAGEAGDKTLTKRWLDDYIEELVVEKIKLQKELRHQIIHAVETSAELSIQPQEEYWEQLFKITGIDTGPHFKTMFSTVQKGVVEDIVSGELYKDKRTLSQRIWNYSQEFEKDIQYTISRAILEKKSAIELARDLEKYVKDPAKRSADWGNCYPYLKNKKVDYNAQRLARTSINHAYQTASIKSSSMNPFVEGIEWRSALIHGRTCELCRERHGQIYPKDDVPLDHPNGLCTMIPCIPKSTQEVAAELRDWIDGETNPILDEWYNKYGDLFAYKSI